MATGRVPTTANSPLTAKGDLFTYSTAPARLAVGNSGETIVADSSTSTGLRWQGNFDAGKNKFINGDFNVWQRGTSFTNPADQAYNADRFKSNGNGTGATKTISRQAFTPGTAPVAGYEGQYFYRFAQTVAGTGATYNNGIQQTVEDARTFAGQTVTWSFWAKADSARTLYAYVEKYYGTGGSGYGYITVGSVTLTTSWTRYSFTFAVPSVAGTTIGANSYFQPYFSMDNNTVQTFDFWGWQIEAGSVATAFQTATGTIQGELAACQRYFERMVNGADNSSETIGVFQCFSTTQGYGTLRFVVPKRSTPSLTFSGNADFIVKDASGTNRATTLMASGTYSPRTANVTFTIGTANLVAGNAAWMLANSATATMDVSAEL
jgi:hypothetical protein